MSRKKKKDNQMTEDRQTVNPEDAADTTVAESPEEAAAPLTLEEQIEQLRDDKRRLQAELQNVVKRTQRDKQDALKFAEADFARDLLLVLDDLERTRESVESAEDVQAVSEGLRIVYDHFMKVLRGRGIETIDAAGTPFDPDRHEAMMQQPSDEHPAGTVLQEYQRGYRMHGRVLRPAKVVVSGGGAGRNATETDAVKEE